MERGFKIQHDHLQAAIARVQLQKLEGFLAIRRVLGSRVRPAVTWPGPRPTD